MTISLSRPGQVNGAGNADALFLMQFGGEVLTAFTESTAFLSRHVVRSIQNGKSAQFPATWRASASYHTPGTPLPGQTINSGERTIVIDDLLQASVFIHSIDEAKSHFEFRSEYSRQLGYALSRTFDKQVGQLHALAARASATVSGGNGGTRLVAASARTNASTLIATIGDAAQALDEKDVPKNDRNIYLPHDLYYLLIGSGDKALSRDFNPEGNGSVASGQMFRLYGMPLVPTNHFPAGNVTDGPTAYRGDFTNTAALVAQRGAVGTVKLLDLAVESEYLTLYQSTLVVAKYAMGHGILRPECAVEIAVA
jgi:hypothetical protein